MIPTVTVLSLDLPPATQAEAICVASALVTFGPGASLAVSGLRVMPGRSVVPVGYRDEQWTWHGSVALPPEAWRLLEQAVLAAAATEFPT